MYRNGKLNKGGLLMNFLEFFDWKPEKLLMVRKVVDTCSKIKVSNDGYSTITKTLNPN